MVKDAYGYEITADSATQIEGLMCWNNNRMFSLIKDRYGIFWSGWDINRHYPVTWEYSADNLGSNQKEAKRLHKIEVDKLLARIKEDPTKCW